MPKVRRAQSPSIDLNRSYPYPSNSKNDELHIPRNLLGSVDDMKEWEDAVCPICMEPPHNAVLLKCSSHEMGCRPFMCNTSYRHSNCLDQFCKSFDSHLSSTTLQEIPLTSTTSHSRDIQPESGDSSLCGSQLQPKLICPLCRGDIYGYMVLLSARKYMNSKPRCCSSEMCEFQGTYPELRKHARSEHPSVRPSEVDPSRQCDWVRMEQERDMEDLFSSIHTSDWIRMEQGRDMEDRFSSIHTSSVAEYSGDTDLTGGLAGWMSFYLHEIFSSIEDSNRMANLMSTSRPRFPLHDRRSSAMQRISNDTQTNQSARWRSSLPSAHQPDRTRRGGWRTTLPSSLDMDMEIRRTARWLMAARMPREGHQYSREGSSEVRASSTRMARSSQVAQNRSSGNASSVGRNSGNSSSGRGDGHQLRWRGQRWSNNNLERGNSFNSGR